jgi:hypothetical protein
VHSDIIDGMGTNGCEGTFRKSSEEVLRVLRENTHQVSEGCVCVCAYDFNVSLRVIVFATHFMLNFRLNLKFSNVVFKRFDVYDL